MNNILKWVGAAAIISVSAFPKMDATAQGLSEENVERIYMTSPGYAAEGYKTRADRLARERFKSAREAGRKAAELASERNWPVLYVVDGDTVKVRLPDGRAALVRIRHMDSPETGSRASCQGERDKGDLARAYLSGVLDASSRVVFLRPTTNEDKYGRILADMLADGSMVSRLMISAGLARPYDGGRRQSWCP